MYPSNLKFSKDHEWVRVEGAVAVVGISDFAQKHLGDVVYVDLPAVGTVLGVHQTIGTIESVKAVSEVFAPVSGEVVEINGGLADAPEKINQDPHGEGWILKVKPANPADLDALMTAPDYEKYLEGLEH